jgi:hypothetical protein
LSARGVTRQTIDARHRHAERARLLADDGYYDEGRGQFQGAPGGKG